MSCIEHFGYYENIVHFPEHQHTACEIMYLHKGHMSILCDNNEFDMTDGMLYIIPSGVKHKGLIKNTLCYKRTLIFLNPWVYTREYYSDAIYNILTGFDMDKPIVVSDSFECLRIINAIKKEFELGDMVSEDIIVSCVTELLAQIIRKTGYISKMRKKPNKLVAEVQRYIQENCGSKILISDIADEHFISKFYLSHIFKEQTGMSPKQFLTFTRLSKAYNLLHEPNIKISEISEQCGFTSPSDMTKKFREKYNISPVGFRKQLLSKSKNDINQSNFHIDFDEGK